MSSPDPEALRDPQPDAAPASEPRSETGPEPSGAEAPRLRTHPITPLVTGWKVVVGIIAVVSAQNIARLINDFSVTKALIGAGVIFAAVVIAIALSTLSWWFMTYAVDDEGVSLHSGVISKSREYAPRARIESVSVERPLLARLLGLAKVRVEVAGGGESYLDIEYVKSAAAEKLRQEILGVADRSGAGTGRSAGEASAPRRSVPATGETRDAQEAPGAIPAPDDGQTDPAASGTVASILYDGVTDGELIAQVPTERLVRSLLRDIGFLVGIVMSIVGVGVAIALAIWQDGLNIAMIIALAPTLITVPKYVFGRIESGWGFISRITDRGLRMRRGLANTRTDNIASGRIQRFELRRPLLWRAPGWTAVSVTVAGIEDDDENGAENVLPVGTRAELGATLGHLAAPLGTDDDRAALEHLITAPARQIEGIRTPARLFWISRRTEVTVLLPGAVIHRSGILAKKVEIIPRERIQQVELHDGPLARRLGLLDLEVRIAGDSLSLSGISRDDALALHGVLARDARTLRRYRDRAQWPAPALGRAACMDTSRAETITPAADLQEN